MNNLKFVNEIKSKNNLKDLFDLWRKEQENDEFYYPEKTGISRKSFTNDGCVNEELWHLLKKKGGIKVLYLLREANGSSYITYKEDEGEYVEVDKNEFWFKKQIEDKKASKSIFKKIEAVQNIIEENTINSEVSEETKDSPILSRVAFMNVNKRGGSSSVNWSILINYAKNYSEYIKKEIEILQPNIIICCGTYWSMVDHILNAYGKSNWMNKENEFHYNWKLNDRLIDIYNMPHPSRRGMSVEKFAEEFIRIHNGKECVTFGTENEDTAVEGEVSKEVIDSFKKIIEKNFNNNLIEDDRILRELISEFIETLSE